MRKFGLRDKLGYMFGDFGNNFFFLLVSFFLMVFYTDVIGASPTSVGVLFLLAKVWDAFIDLAWGRFIDTRNPTKNGKFRPWIIRMSLPLVLFGVLIFTKPAFLSGRALVIFSFSMYIIWGTLYSTINIPYGSLASVITNDPIERAGLSTFRGIGFNLASLFVGTVIPIYAFVNNKADGNRFFIIALTAAILAMICYVLCYRFTTERVILDEVKSNEKNKSNFRHTLKGLVRNKPLIILIIISFIIIFSSLLTGTINAYLYKDYFNNAKALGTFTIVSTLATLAIASLTTKAATKYGKKETSSIALIISSIIYFALFLVPIRNVYIFIILSTLGYLGFGFFNYLNWAFVTDVIDYHEYLTGRREDGTVYAIYSFIRKIGQAVAGLGGGIALQIVGYEQGVGIQQKAEVADKIRQLAMITPAISYGAIALVFIFIYPLGKNRIEELSIEMKKRRS